MSLFAIWLLSFKLSLISCYIRHIFRLIVDSVSVSQFEVKLVSVSQMFGCIFEVLLVEFFQYFVRPLSNFICILCQGCEIACNLYIFHRDKMVINKRGKKMK